MWLPKLLCVSICFNNVTRGTESLEVFPSKTTNRQSLVTLNKTYNLPVYRYMYQRLVLPQSLIIIKNNSVKLRDAK